MKWYKITVCFAMCVVCVFGFESISLGDTVILSEDFENFDSAQWHPTTKNGGSVTIQSSIVSPSGGSTKALYVNSPSTSDRAYVLSYLPDDYTITNDTKFTVQFDYYLSSSITLYHYGVLVPTLNAAPAFYNATGPNLLFTSSNSLVNRVGGSYYGLSGAHAIDTDRWVRITIDASAGDGTYELNLYDLTNNVNWGTFGSYTLNGDWNVIGWGAVDASGAGYYDNLVITLVPEPTTMSLVCIGFIGFLKSKKITLIP